jgi:hypothetical protein
VPAAETTIERLRGRPSDRRTEEILALLSREGGLADEAARRWLSEAVGAAIADDRVIGVNAVRRGRVPLIGGRGFWIYRSVLAEPRDELWTRMFTAAFDSLADGFDPTEAGPIGLCVLIEDRGLIERQPEAVWPQSELMFAGYLDDGRQVRIRYFWNAAIAPGLPDSPSLEAVVNEDYPLEPRYRIQALTDDGGVTADDVLRLWMSEGVVPEDEARRRVGEVQLVGTDREAGVVGVSTVYLQRNPRLRMPLWHYRTYVARAHRESNLAGRLLFANRDLLEQRFISGADRRAAGMIFQLQNEGLKRHFNRTLMPADFTFIGETQQGDHVRVHYFPGARVPKPDAEAQS